MDESTEFEEFLQARWRRLFATAYLLTGDRAEADELLHEAMARTRAVWPKVEATGSAEAYARQILVSRAIRGRRVGRGRRKAPATSHEACSGVRESVESRLDLWPAIRALPPRLRAGLVLCYFDELNEQEAADALRCSVWTVRRYCAAAKAQLSARLAADAIVDTLEDACATHSMG